MFKIAELLKHAKVYKFETSVTGLKGAVIILIRKGSQTILFTTVFNSQPN